MEVIQIPRGSLTVHSCPDGISGLVDQDTSIVTKPNKGTIWSLQFLLHAYNDGVTDITTADLAGERSRGGGFGACRSLLLDDDDNSVTYFPNDDVSLSFCMNAMYAGRM